MTFYPEQCRAARGLLNWTQDHLAAVSGVSRSTIKDFECLRHSLHRSSEVLLVDTFQSNGVSFFVESDDVMGVRLRGARKAIL